MSAKRQVEKLMTVFDLEHPAEGPERRKRHTRVMVIYDRTTKQREYKILSKGTSKEQLARIRPLIEATLEAKDIA